MLGPSLFQPQNRSRKLLKRYFNDLDVKLAFSSFKISNMFSVKYPVPVELRSNVVYKFTCVSCKFLAMSAKPADTSLHAFAKTLTGTGPHISINTFNNLRLAAIPALLNVSKL